LGHSLSLTLPPLAVVWFAVPNQLRNRLRWG
jgi:hypothetical protein